MSPLSGDIPDPSFPPVPPQGWPARGPEVEPVAFADLGDTQPIENQPIHLEATPHLTTVVPAGGDPVTEESEAQNAIPTDETLTETPEGADWS